MTNAITLPNNWRPRDYQMDVWSYLEKGGRHAEYVWHRRAGKDDIGLRWSSVDAMQRVGTYWYMLPMASQARKAIWTAINPHTGLKRIDEAFPLAMRTKTNQQEMYIEFMNGSTWQVVGSDNFNSLVGSPPVGIVYSEWALTNPAAKAYLRPIMAENKGWQIFNTTPRGKNHAYRTLNGAMKDPNSFAQVLTVDDTQMYSREELDHLRAEYITDFGETLGNAFFEQEFYCSFETPVMGAVFGKELREATPRITLVPYDPSKKVLTAWDLGRADKTAIWFVQLGAFEVRVIDYMEFTGKHIGDIIVDIKRKPYRFGTTWLPHDANNQLLASRKTVAQQLRDEGFETRTVTKTSISTRINALRLLFPMMYFDATKTDEGRNALMNYRYRVDETTHQFSDEPLHDWASHASDALTYLAIALTEEKPKNEPLSARKAAVQTNQRPGGAWM